MEQVLVHKFSSDSEESEHEHRNVVSQFRDADGPLFHGNFNEKCIDREESNTTGKQHETFGDLRYGRLYTIILLAYVTV